MINKGYTNKAYINYDSWKTTPPEEDDPYTCPICGGPMEEEEYDNYESCYNCQQETES